MSRLLNATSYILVFTAAIYIILASIYHEKANDWVILGINQTQRQLRSYATLANPLQSPKPLQSQTASSPRPASEPHPKLDHTIVLS